MPPSLARNFFDRITRSENPLAAIRQIINPNDPLFESHWLDFKAEEQPKPGRTPDLKQQEQSNRREWSEYLSAFANTGGGVVLWGIDARKKEIDGRLLDFAGAEALMTDPIGLASSLNDWQGQATDPQLSGVEIRPYPVPENPKKGFVLCYIPDGPFKPYQSLQTNNKQYYHRGGASNFVMPRPTLAAMFLPRMQARFQGIAKLEYKMIPGSTPTRTQILCRMGMRNVGTATAGGADRRCLRAWRGGRS